MLVNGLNITVTKEPEADWRTLQAKVILTLNKTLDGVGAALATQQPAQVGTESVPAPDTDGDTSPKPDEATSLEACISEVLHKRVQPDLAQHGGAVELQAFQADTGTAWVELSGACDGYVQRYRYAASYLRCPSSVATVKERIEAVLRFYFEEARTTRRRRFFSHCVSSGQGSPRHKQLRERQKDKACRFFIIYVGRHRTLWSTASFLLAFMWVVAAPAAG